MKRCKKLRSESELPDCVMSYIFSKLALKDLVKTSVLSKRWIHEWGLRMDLNFDLHTMFDYNTIHDLPKSLPLFQRFHFLSEFAKSLDQFMFHYQGDMIHSIRINFPLGNEQGDLIDRLISKGIAKGVKRIELLFKSETNDAPDYTFHILPNDITDSILPYEFSLILLSNNDSLTYLHLQNCLLVEPTDLSGLKNLRTLVLHLVDLKQKLLQSLCSHCSHIVDLTLDDCQFTSSLIINSPTLLHLNIVNCGVSVQRYITIIAPNLSSFEYSCNENFAVHPMNIQAPMLSKFIFRGDEFSNPVGFSGLKNVTTMRLGGLMENLCKHILPYLFSECLQLEEVTFYNCILTSSLVKITSPKLRHLNLIRCGFASKSPYDIVIDALNLSSFECCGYTRMVFVKAPRLLKVFWNAALIERKTRYPFGPIERLQHIENLALTIGSGQIEELTKVLGQFQNLKQLELFVGERYNSDDIDYFWILDIAMASQHLHKLSLTINNLHLRRQSHMVGFKRQKREYAGFYHNDLKYVEFHGCVCSINVIELASYILRNVNSLKKMTFSSRNKFYEGAGKWTDGKWPCRWFEQNVIQEMLKDEVNEPCQLIIL